MQRNDMELYQLQDDLAPKEDHEQQIMDKINEIDDIIKYEPELNELFNQNKFVRERKKEL